MSIEHVFRDEAFREYHEAAMWYQDKEQGLGDAFADEVEAAIERIVRSPETWPIARGDLRRVLVHRFPYEVFYRIEASRIVIVAVLHGHRDPSVWQDR